VLFTYPGIGTSSRTKSLPDYDERAAMLLKQRVWSSSIS